MAEWGTEAHWECNRNLPLRICRLFATINQVKRILVIGHPGSGKSTLATALSEAFALPIIHLDKEFWQPGWIKMPEDKWQEKIRTLIAQDRWIMDGTFDRNLEIRLPRADTVIFLDYSRYICLWRIFRRIISYYGRVRPDMTEGCPEKLDFVFLNFVWNYRRDRYPMINKCLRGNHSNFNLIVLNNPSETANFMRSLREGRR